MYRDLCIRLLEAFNKRGQTISVLAFFPLQALFASMMLEGSASIPVTFANPFSICVCIYDGMNVVERSN